MNRIKDYCVAQLAFHPPQTCTYTFNPTNMKYLIEPELKEVLIYFQPIPDSGVTFQNIETLKYDERPVILFSHGNAEDVGSYFNYCRWMANKFNCHVLTYDYYNYGLSSTASCSEESLLEAATSVYKYLKKLNVKLCLVGKSIGTVPSIFIASTFNNDENILGLILISPLASGIRCLSISHFLTESMVSSFDSIFGDSLSRIKDVNCLVLFLHGLQDTVISSDNTSVLYSALTTANKKKAHPLPKFFGSAKKPATHCNLETVFEESFVRHLQNFLAHIIPEKKD